jgi:PTH2 family peptidyl-tRNA hydrolase
MPYDQGAMIIGTSIATFIGGFLLGVWSIQGYILSPALAEERRAALHDPIESDESDVDEDDTIMDHAPNWSNGLQADKKQGLSATAQSGIKDNGEECKLVLVVRTDLGMTKGRHLPSPFHPETFMKRAMY